MIRYAFSTGAEGSETRRTTVLYTPSLDVAPLKMSFPRRKRRFPALRVYASRKQPRVDRTVLQAGWRSLRVESPDEYKSDIVPETTHAPHTCHEATHVADLGAHTIRVWEVGTRIHGNLRGRAKQWLWYQGATGFRLQLYDIGSFIHSGIVTRTDCVAKRRPNNEHGLELHCCEYKSCKF